VGALDGAAACKLDFPSALLQAAVWRERRLVIEELDPPAKP
jgi:hypothetical protein